MKHHHNKYPSKPSRHVTVRSPSEEDLFQASTSTSSGKSDLDTAWSRRPPTPYALTRHDIYNSEEEVGPTTAHSDKHKKNHTTSTSSASLHPAIQPYNNPAGTTPQLGQNHIYHHVVAPSNSYFPGQHFVSIAAASSNAPTHHAVNFAGQPQPLVFVNKDGTMSYQNASQPSAGLHFQPQTPDTTYGPMVHHYIPRHDGGGIAYAMQPGIVCPPIPSIPSSTYTASFSIPLVFEPQRPPRHITFATEPLLATPAVAVASSPLVIYPAAAFAASASFMTTLGYSSDDKTVVPREIIVVR